MGTRTFYRWRVIAGPPLPPPVIEQPAPRQVSYGLVTGTAARGTRRVLVRVDGRLLANERIRGRRFSLRITLPPRDGTVQVTAVAGDGRRARAFVRDVYGLPAAARPRNVTPRSEPALARKLRAQLRRYHGTAAVYVESLTTGEGAAWNAAAHFPAASTLKLAIAVAVLARQHGIPAPRSYVGGLLREMIVPSDDRAANSLLVWLQGSTSAGGGVVTSMMHHLGLRNSVMYGGYEVRSLSARVPVRVDVQPAFGIGKYTSAWDLARLHRLVWLASANRGRLRAVQPGFTAADARHLLWLLAHVRDTPKLDRFVRHADDVSVLHKAGWISAARHDSGLVFWRGGVFVISVMTWRASGVGRGSDVLAGRCAQVALAQFRRQRG
jgi:Beta-lactamase enzyme family